MNNRNSFFTVLEAFEKSNKGHHLQDLVRSLPPGILEAVSAISFIRVLSPFTRALPPDLTPPKGPSNTVTLGLGFQHMNLEGGDTNI
jgi:hypothetical protein